MRLRLSPRLFHLPREVRTLMKLHLAGALGAFPVSDNPDVCEDASVVEELVGQADDASSMSF